jgi:hypothetical protein
MDEVINAAVKKRCLCALNDSWEKKYCSITWMMLFEHEEMRWTHTLYLSAYEQLQWKRRKHVQTKGESCDVD